MHNLEQYRRKRNFAHTPEPAGAEFEQAYEQAMEGAAEGGQFVIHKHAATRLHYDLRLEHEGVYKSWAVPKGPSLVPGEKRLAVHVEDHPLEYGDFEGVIPAKQYGGGTVMLWDRGRWAQLKRRGKRGLEDGHLDFVLAGEKLRGVWSLIRTSGRNDEGDNWLLIKRRDTVSDQSQLTDLSVATGRTMEQIASDKSRTWTRGGEVDAQAVEVPDPASLPGAVKKAMPRKIEVSLATLDDKAPPDDDWLHEIKFDGYRIVAFCKGGSVRLMSRNNNDWTQRFSETASLLKNIPADAIIDGEIVAFAADGTTSFRALQEALSAKDTRTMVYQAFDLIYLNGFDLTRVPLTERKQALADLLAASGFTGRAGVRYTEHIVGQGPAFSEQACRLGLEGIICKRADSGYRSGRSRHWLKVKCTAREELVIGGFTNPGGARKGFGALLLGGWRNGKLIYAGKVGTGFSEQMLQRLHTQLRTLETDHSPFAQPPDERGAHWVKPELIAEVEFTEWTRDGVLRHASFRGMREDRDPDKILLPDAVPDRAASPARTKSPAATPRNLRDTAEIAGVKLTNASRVLYPELGITKLALAQFYQDIAPWILPQLALRPLSLVRCPEGYRGECFFQKHPRNTVDKSVPRILIEESSGPSPYLYVQSLADIIALVQIGALELHVWGSRVADVEHPDILVFDLDPAPDVPLAELLRVARDLHDHLQHLGLESFPRTTGGKGLHLVVPVKPERSWEEAKLFCHQVARAQAREDPRRVTAKMAKTKRKGKIFVDYLRNGRGATAISSYSARARTGAPVAVPVSWSEVTSAMQPDRYNVENLRRRLTVLTEDPWHNFEAARAPLSDEAMRAVDAASDDN